LDGFFGGIALKKQAQYYIDQHRFDTANSVQLLLLASPRSIIAIFRYRPNLE